MWIARDLPRGKDRLGYLVLYEEKPIRNPKGDFHRACSAMNLNKGLFPEIINENSPVEVELKVKEKQVCG